MITIVLHTHLPYVLHHGNWPHGSDWLCEAVAECYIPLLRMCKRLQAEGMRPGITFDVSPVLCEQLTHPDFPAVFETYCREHTDLALLDKETFQAEGAEAQKHLAQGWADWYQQQYATFRDEFEFDIVGQFRKLQDEGAIEVLTCGATHGYLPLLADDASVDLQIQLAVENYKKHFGRQPKGIWLPECAYRPAYPWRTYLPVAAYAIAKPRRGIEQFLEDYNLDYFVTDEGALAQSTPLGVLSADGKRTPFAETFGAARQQLELRSPLYMYRAGSDYHQQTAAFFTRHRQIALQVWSGETGYPGDPDYLDFHKKYFRSALRYWRVTDNKADMQWKQQYVPEWAEHRALDHARHFTDILETTVRYNLGRLDQTPTICLPFDTELFGHWWFEGPLFLEHVLRNIHSSQVLTATTTTERFLQTQPRTVVALPESSWGRNGHHDVWMNSDVQWTWEREYLLEHRIKMLMQKHSSGDWDHNMLRLISNAFRQMLLAQASDWQFLISTFSSREYAQMRFHNHAEDALLFANAAERYATSKELPASILQNLNDAEQRDGIFTEELRAYLSSRGGAE